MALDLPLPEKVLVHGHWTMNREKMSKSTGNVVNPFFAIERFGVDGMRFFLIYQGGLADDADYDNEFIIRDYKKFLQGGIGNLTWRFISVKKGKLRSYIQDATSDKLPSPSAADREHQTMLIEVPPKVAEHMTGLNPRAALQEIIGIIEKVWALGRPARPGPEADLVFLLPHQTHKYFHAMQPWKMPNPEWVMFNVAESLRISGILLQPFMPGKSQELLQLLGVDINNPSKRTFAAAVYGSDADYGEIFAKHMVFPPLPTED